MSALLKKSLFTLLKLGIPAAIFAYLLMQVPREDYRVLWEGDKNWGRLLGSQVVAVAAILVSFLRWRVLVRAMEIPFTLSEAFRLGFLGYLLNFVSFGSIGGDIFKAVLAAKDKPDKRPEAVASVLLDRAFGLLGLVILSFGGLAAIRSDQLTTPLIAIRNGAGVVALASIFALLLAIYSGKWFDKLTHWVRSWPLLGPSLARMIQAVRQLRGSPEVLLLMGAYSIGVHFLLATAVYLISSGFYVEHPSFSEHLMIVPPSMAVGTLPLAPGGMGYQEAALATLFKQLPSIPEGYSAILVATFYRLVTLGIAGIGLVYYLSGAGRKLTEEAEKAIAEMD